MDTIAGDFRVAFAADAGWREMTDACVAGLGPTAGAKLGFVYLTDTVDETLPAVIARLRDSTRIYNWVGTLGFGVCVAGREMFDRPAMAIMTAALPSDSFRVLPSVTSPDDRLPEDVLGWAREHHPMLGVVHADPRAPALERILHAIQKQTGCFLVGGMTASRGAMDQVAVDVTDGGVSGVLFAATVPVATGLTQGCSPIGPVHEVTRSRENVILQLDSRPAFEVFREDIGELLARNLARIEGYVHAALPVAGSDTGDYTVRNLLGVYPEQGWISIGERIGVGDRVMFVRRDGASAMADLKRMVADTKRRAGKAPRAALYYSCVARGPNLFGEGSVELRTISDALGNVPLIGFFANGEISNDRLYGYTGVLTLIL